jgi:Arc/MetJ-type ribon-helix-helix transcriptional regulator
MTSLQISLPEKIDNELNEMVKKGWFRDKEEIIHFSIMEFARHYHFDLMEQFQEEDIKWALEQKG